MTTLLVLLLIGVVVGVTTVLFGFGGGFVTVPVITILNLPLGDDAVRVATATSALVMLVNAVVATAATPHVVLRRLRGALVLFGLLALGGAVGAGAARYADSRLLKWGFVAYIVVTVVDLLVRPGFIRPQHSAGADVGATTTRSIPARLGLPIGALAAFLGVGGSVMTVPMMRRAGTPMGVAAALANPLTLVITVPALVVSLVMTGRLADSSGLVGSVDLGAGIALLVGSLPLVVLLRRRPPAIPEAVHAWVYIVLLLCAAAAVAVFG